MNLPKCDLLLTVGLILISTGSQSASNESTWQPRYTEQRWRRQASSQSHNAPAYWEHILREFVFKTISPPPPGNHNMYRRLLEAPFYGGPFPIVSNDAASVVLSRGDVYYLADGHWLLCQQGCIECKVCAEYTHPTVKWVLRRIKRVAASGTTRQDLQLTIVPQIDGSYHMRSLWPRSYVYVTSQGERDAYLSDEHSHRNDGTAYVNPEQNIPKQRVRHFWTYVEKNSLPDKRVVQDGRNDTIVPSTERAGTRDKDTAESTTATHRKENAEDERIDSTDVKTHRPKGQIVEKQNSNGSSIDVRMRENGSGRLRQLAPKLILGTDQLGQKHLVHVVPADVSSNATLMDSLARNIFISAGHNRTAYQRILRRIFDSLHSNKRSIEMFLDPPGQADRKPSEEREEHQQQETRGGLPGLRQTGRVYPIRSNRNRNEASSQEQGSRVLNSNRQRRGSIDRALVDRFLNTTMRVIRNFDNTYNSTVHRERKGDNIPFVLNSKSKQNINYGNGTLANHFRYNNVGPNRDYSIESRRYKIVISTESANKTG